MNKRLILLTALLPLFCSCDDFATRIPDGTTTPPKSNILKFESVASLNKAIDEGVTYDSRGNVLETSIADNKSALRSTQDNSIMDWGELVPDENFAKLLNTKGEIQVGDTIYAINGCGTFYAHINDYAEMREVIQDTSRHLEGQVTDRLYRIGNVYRYDTFGISYQSTDEFRDNNSVEEQPATRSSLPEPNISTFEKVPGRRHTVVGKFFQGLSVRYSHTIPLGGTSDRRLNCAMFDYNYVIRQAIGISAKVEQKMWYGGWAKVKSWGPGEIRCGFTTLILRFPYPKGSSYDEIYSRIFRSNRTPEIRPSTSPFVILGGDGRYINTEYNRDTGAVDVSVLPMIDSDKPSEADINTAVGMFAKAIYFKFKGAYSTVGHYQFEGKDAFDPSRRYDRPTVTEVLSVINGPVTVFGRDGIYVAYPPMFDMNKSGENAIYTRPFYSYVNEAKISLSASFGQGVNLRDIYNNIKLDFGNPDVSIVSAEGFACGHHRFTGWSGYRLYW